MKLLILRLEGMLQSWGDRPHWDHRGTAEMPTKSGIVGLLGCAMGIGRGDSRLRELGETLSLAVRADRRASLLHDDQTVQSLRGKFPNASGGVRNGNTLLTPKDYLEDACYTAFIAAPEETLEACAAALRHPVWTPCLGRRSCPPTRPLLPLISEAYSSLEDAAHHFRWENPPVRRASANLLYEIDDGSGLLRRYDQPIDASRNQYAQRRVRQVYEKEGYPCS